MYPNTYNTIKKFKLKINIRSGCQLGNKNHYYWENSNQYQYCLPHTRFGLCAKKITFCCKRKFYDYTIKRTTIEYY